MHACSNAVVLILGPLNLPQTAPRLTVAHSCTCTSHLDAAGLQRNCRVETTARSETSTLGQWLSTQKLQMCEHAALLLNSEISWHAWQCTTLQTFCAAHET